jgi:hypothetical protein
LASYANDWIGRVEKQWKLILKKTN